MQLKICGLRSNRANSEVTNGPRRSHRRFVHCTSIDCLSRRRSRTRSARCRATCEHGHLLGRQNTSAVRPAYSGDLCPSKWSLKASSFTFSTTTRPGRTRPCGTWQKSNGPSPSAALTSDMAILDEHGQRHRRIPAVRCASPNRAAAIDPEAEAASSFPKSRGTFARRLGMKPHASREPLAQISPGGMTEL